MRLQFHPEAEPELSGAILCISRRGALRRRILFWDFWGVLWVKFKSWKNKLSSCLMRSLRSSAAGTPSSTLRSGTGSSRLTSRRGSSTRWLRRPYVSTQPANPPNFESSRLSRTPLPIFGSAIELCPLRSGNSPTGRSRCSTRTLSTPHCVSRRLGGTGPRGLGCTIGPSLLTRRIGCFGSGSALTMSTRKSSASRS